MTYEAYDAKFSGGQPVELYEFIANNATYRYASRDADLVTAGSVSWEGVILSRSRFTTGTALERAGVSVTTSIALPFLEVFEDGFPEGAVQLSIYRTHASDPDGEIRLVWEGQITSRVFQHKQIVLKGEVPDVSLRSLGLRRMYQVPCPYPLYSSACQVQKSAHVVEATVTVVSGVSVTVDLEDCSSFSGGFLAMARGGVDVTRFIQLGSGYDLTLKQEASWLVVGAAIRLYPGCDKSIQTCQTRFANTDNYGGFTGMPRDNPFNTQVY